MDVHGTEFLFAARAVCLREEQCQQSPYFGFTYVNGTERLCVGARECDSKKCHAYLSTWQCTNDTPDHVTDGGGFLSRHVDDKIFQCIP